MDRTWLKRILAIGLGFFALGYLLTALLFFPGSGRDPVATVPDLRELTLADAERALDAAELELELGDSLPHPEVGAGRVLSHSPLPGQEVAPGSAVRVLVSTGPERRAVPVVSSLTREQAVRLLTATGFQVTVEELPDRRAAGQVIGVEPSVGTRLPVPSQVRLRVSQGPPLVAVPDVRGLTEGDAEEALAAAGLRPGAVEFNFEGLGVEEVVREQDPLPGDSVRQGSGVRLWISSSRLPGVPVR